MEKLTRYEVTGVYKDIIYAQNEDEARDIFAEMNEFATKYEGEFDVIIVKEAKIE